MKGKVRLKRDSGAKQTFGAEPSYAPPLIYGTDMAYRDALTLALQHTSSKLTAHNFELVGRRDLLSLSGGIVRLLNFQLSTRGERAFCVNVAAYALCGNDHPVLQPGFRLRDRDGCEMWMRADPIEDSRSSVEIVWKAIQDQALPWFKLNANLEGHLSILRAETWSSLHHLYFQLGVVEAMLAHTDDAVETLARASRLYAEDGRNWCAGYIAKAAVLIEALKQGHESAVLERWRADNLANHRPK